MTNKLTVLGTAAREYYSRPADERYDSPEALVAFSAQRKAASREIAYNAKDLEIIPAGDDRVQLASPRGVAELTPWSHAQLCRTIGAPAGYVRTLPASIAAAALNHGLRETAPGTTLSILAQLPGLPGTVPGAVTARAITSETYGRLWDADFYGPVVETLGANGWTLPPTWDGKPAGAYSSDRDSFLILVNGGSIVTDPSIRGDGGQMYRGIMLRNSEVGGAAVWLQRVLYEYICGNHNLWGAVIDREYRRRHVGVNVLRDTLREIGATARQWVNRPASADEAIIRKLIDLELAATKDAVIDELCAMGATKTDAAGAYDRCVERFEASPRSFWGIAQGLTSLSQDSGYQDDRLALDQLAAKVRARGSRQLVAA